MDKSSDQRVDIQSDRREDGDIDKYNDETFGEGASEGDWEASHLALSREQEGAQVLSRTATDIMPPNQGFDNEEVLPQVAELKIKELWPSSPQQSTLLASIWTPSQLPQQPKPAEASPLPPTGTKVITLEELEREYHTPSPPQPVTSSPPHTLTPPHSHSVAPPPGLVRMPGRPYPVGPVPPIGMHPQQMMNWMRDHPPPRGPPPPHGFPPMVPHPHIPLLRQRLPAHLLPHPPSHHLHSPHHPPQGPFSPPYPHHHQQQHPPNLHHQQMHGGPGDQGVARKSRRSEYLGEMKADGSGFMTLKEKEWVIKIQLLQLQSPDPSNDDYYYQNYVQRKHSAHGNQKQSLSPSSHLDHSDSEGSPNTSQAQILTLPQVSREERHYTPIVFEKALGKVSVSSISAPRKTIDVPISAGDSSGKESGATNVHAKKRQALIIIEKLYSLVLSLEDLERKALALPEEDRPQMLAQRDEICSKMFSLLKLKTTQQQWTKSDDAVLLQVMSFRKGKRVMKRILPLLSDVHAHVILLALFRNIAAIIKRDSSDQVLPELNMSVQAVISGLEFSLLNTCLATLLVTTAPQLVKVGQNEFGVSLLMALVEQGQKLAKSSREHKNQATTECDKWIELRAQLCTELYPYKEQLSRNVTMIDWLESVSKDMN